MRVMKKGVLTSLDLLRENKSEYHQCKSEVAVPRLDLSSGHGRRKLTFQDPTTLQEHVVCIHQQKVLWSKKKEKKSSVLPWAHDRELSGLHPVSISPQSETEFQIHSP
jgi:hypothetical protein